ncbi:MAG TPA: protease pro-enzyme activation domain-containing protein [Candidatus Sulfotelmatobacter sp.]|nr:protease pro-enzyme activation domain-containing protein [Candidatus Sulfotelmatobacter sp.]
MNKSHAIAALAAVAMAFVPTINQAQTAGYRTIPGNIPAAVPQLLPVGSLPASQELQLAIGLPLRNQDALTNLLEQLYDPANVRFHRWLTPEQFTEQFGPAQADYAKVIDFAGKHGLVVTHQHSNRLLLDVTGSVTNIEQAFHVNLRVYQHPTEKRTFYAPDKDLSVESDVPILHVSGLDNFSIPRSLYVLATNAQGVTPYNGSGPSGLYIGNDFRHAYVPGVTNNGAGQYIAIIDVGGPYYTNDIYMYETNAGFVPGSTVITNILLDGWTGIPVGTNAADGEEALDIDMAMSMAPGATILNYEGGADDVFNQIAIDDKAKQMTLSYGFGLDANNYQSFQEFVAQGQAMSQASGDGGADLNGGTGLTGNPWATIVGGTALTMSGNGVAWESETTWSGSGGGVSGYGVPDWQLGIATPANQGSTVWRNFPDVAMLGSPATFIYINNGSTVDIGGTSQSSPLWAGFMALVNQQAATDGNPPVGFINPAIYRLGQGPASIYTNCFHDITTGNNFNSQSPNKYPATAGYDLCTGWGTPTGSNTINALAGVGTSDFTMSATPTLVNTIRGGVAISTISVIPMNRLSGSISLSISNLPTGIGAAFGSVNVTTNTVLTLTMSNNAAIGTVAPVITATSGELEHSISLNLTVSMPIPGEIEANLASYYNRAGIYSDGRTFSGGLDNDGNAYSANLLGSSPVWNGVTFSLGTPNTLDTIATAGQTIQLPTGNFTSLMLLGTAVNGGRSGLTFTVTYSDGSTTNFTQSFSDWANPQNYPGEFLVDNMPYRNTGGGVKDLNTAVNLYGYSFTIDQTKTVRSITLPNNGNVLLLAITLANDTAPVSLASYYNRAGMYTDGTTFTNPATGGLDGGGNAYSATLLGGSLTWSNAIFDFGPPNATDVVSAAGQTIILPAGNYFALRMLATGVQGDQTSQPFTVTYANGNSATFIQSLSDWYTPQNYSGETEAVTMGYRDLSNGTPDDRTFYLYGYSFNLNSTNPVQSLQLPSNGNVVVLAVSLIPYWPPVFTANPFSEPGIEAGQSYSGTIATSAVDLNGSALTYAKNSGPAWLNIAANGALSGRPLSPDVGANSFVVGAMDLNGSTTNATMTINVTPAPPIALTISFKNASLFLGWTGGIAPYQIQTTTNLLNPDWTDFGNPIGGNNSAIVSTNVETFYRVVGQ